MYDLLDHLRQQQQQKQQEMSEYERLMAGLDESKPELPDFQSVLGDDGMLMPQYQVTDQYDTRALDQLRNEALIAPGQDSVYTSLMRQQLGDEQARAMDSVQAQGSALQAQNLANMGSMGGYDKGSMERMGQRSFRDMLKQKQNNRAEFSSKNLGLSAQNEQNRLSSLNNVASQDMGLAQYRQGIQAANKGAALSELQNQRNADMDRFKIQADMYGSEKNALATQRAAEQQKSSGKK